MIGVVMKDIEAFTIELRRHLEQGTKEIDFSNQELTNDHISILAALIYKSQTITSLNLSGNKEVTDCLMLAVAASVNESLRSINLDNTGIAEDCLSKKALTFILQRLNLLYKPDMPEPEKSKIQSHKTILISNVILNRHAPDQIPNSEEKSAKSNQEKNNLIVERAADRLGKYKASLDLLYSALTPIKVSSQEKMMKLLAEKMQHTAVDLIFKPLKYSVLGALINGIIKFNRCIPGSTITLSCERSFMRGLLSFGFSLYSCYNLSDKDLSKELVVASSSLAVAMAYVLPIENTPLKVAAGLGVLASYIVTSSCAPSRTRTT